MFEFDTKHDNNDYNKFLSFLKLMKINNTFFSKFQKNILEMITNDRTIKDTWENYFYLIDFNYKEYLEAISKTDTNDQNIINTIICYNIFFFTLVKYITEKVLETNNVKNSTQWIKKQIFTIDFLFKNSKFEKEIHLYLDSNIDSINELIKHDIDLIKVIYEEIIPSKFKKLLGEFYTPDWLITLILNNLNIQNQKFIDPASGSASFLKQILNKILLDFKSKDGSDIRIILDRILGFDINMFTVQIARMNLLLSLRKDLDAITSPVVMPIYFADSLFNPFIEDDTSLLRTPIKNTTGWKIENFSRINLKRRLDTSEISNSDLSFFIYENLAKKFSYISNDLEKEFLIGNYIAYRIQKRDIAIGNPPWLAWDGINSGYRKILSTQWKFLFTQQGWRAKVAAGRVDLSAMFVYASQMYFIKEMNCQMIYVLPLSLFKSKSAAEGFRKFKSQKGIFSPINIWDFSHLAIFSGVTNQTIVTFFETGKELVVPINWSIFTPKNKKKIPRNMNVDNFAEYIDTHNILGLPISKNDMCSPWASVTNDQIDIIQKMEGKSFYRARGGINTGGANTIFWLKIFHQEDEYYSIQNIGKSIRANSHIVHAKVEKQLVYKLIRGRDVEQWRYKSDLSIILPYDPKVDTKNAIPEEQLKEKYPLTYNFLYTFHAQLIQRKEFKRWNEKGPFYELYRIGPYTFSPYKVIWQHTGLNMKMKACVLSANEEKIMIDQKIIFVPFDSEDEAYYFCAIINSDIVFRFLNAYLMLDASTHILEHLAIPKFDSTDIIHLELVKISKICHQLAKNVDEMNIHIYREKIDTLVENIWNLKK